MSLRLVIVLPRECFEHFTRPIVLSINTSVIRGHTIAGFKFIKVNCRLNETLEAAAKQFLNTQRAHFSLIVLLLQI